jgi:hypothetical protein
MTANLAAICMFDNLRAEGGGPKTFSGRHLAGARNLELGEFGTLRRHERYFKNSTAVRNKVCRDAAPVAAINIEAASRGGVLASIDGAAAGCAVVA